MILTNHYQNAYVTADIDRAVSVLLEEFAAPGDPMRVDTKQHIWTSSGEGEAALRLAFIQIGRLQYELIQPISGPVTLYQEAIQPDRLLTFHHVAMRADDLDAVREESEKHGRKVVLKGEAREQGIGFLFLDARDTLGHYLEYVCAPEGFWKMIQQAGGS